MIADIYYNGHKTLLTGMLKNGNSYYYKSAPVPKAVKYIKKRNIENSLSPSSTSY